MEKREDDPMAPHDDEVRETVALLFEVAGEMRHRFEATAQRVGLTPQQIRALRLLEDAPLPMHEIADRLRCDRSNVTGIVDRLERNGLVRRETDPEDRRRRRLVVTPEGADVRARFHDELLASRPGVTALDADQLAVLRGLLEKSLRRSRTASEG